MAFQNYKPVRSFSEQKWVGLDNFRELFQDERFYLVLRNTLAMSMLGLIFGFVVPILFAVMLNEPARERLQEIGSDDILPAPLCILGRCRRDCLQDACHRWRDRERSAALDECD